MVSTWPDIRHAFSLQSRFQRAWGPRFTDGTVGYGGVGSAHSQTARTAQAGWSPGLLWVCVLLGSCGTLGALNASSQELGQAFFPPTFPQPLVPVLVMQRLAGPACRLEFAIARLPFCHRGGTLPLGSRLCRCCQALHVKFASFCIRAEASVLGLSKPFLVLMPPSSAACFCPCSGSDAASIQTRAVLSEDGTFYVLNGSKVRLLACRVSAPPSPPALTAVHAPEL